MVSMVNVDGRTCSSYRGTCVGYFNIKIGQYLLNNQFKYPTEQAPMIDGFFDQILYRIKCNVPRNGISNNWAHLVHKWTDRWMETWTTRSHMLKQLQKQLQQKGQLVKSIVFQITLTSAGLLSYQDLG